MKFRGPKWSLFKSMDQQQIFWKYKYQNEPKLKVISGQK